jgi:4-amino-4-deoxy-L-arabinose transferase-like glycosyltransferase
MTDTATSEAPAGPLQQVRPLFENVSESATACLITMVQGNVLALGVGHWIIASQTGLAAGFFATIALYASKGRGRWVVAGVLAVCTAGFDFLMHDSGFGSAVTEAIVTGVGAGLLSLAVSTWKDRRRAVRVRA